jgi:hypothetical protein|tara:strand:- start:28 stop:1323 length:1296 start_codon:yes stop_codon:yes gene_type:complete
MRYSHHHNLLDQHNILNPNNTGLYSNYPLGPSWFPLREKTNLQKGWDNMFLQLGKTFLKGVSNPYAVYMGVGKIDYLEMPSTILDTKPKNRMNKKGLKIYLLEPLSTYHVNDDPDKGPLYTNYEIDDIENVRAKELDSISKFVERNGLTNVSVYTPDYKVNEYFGLTYPDLKLFCSPIGWCYPATMDLNIEIPPSKDIVKKFWCGNWKYAPHRHLIASYLAGNFDSSDYHLSWIYSSSQSILRNNVWFDITNLPNYDSILEGAQKLDLIAPSTMGIELTDALDINDPAPDLHINTNPVEYYNESFCAIVNETRFAQATGILTEKIMNPMINCKPFIMVGPPGNLEYMRKWGFQTFSDYWDESYDIEECHHKRLAKIFELINWLGNMSIEELRELYEKMLPTVMFNQVHILDLQEKLLQEPITKNILFKRLG